MLFIDSHLDLSMNAMRYNRDITLPAYTLRSQEKGFGIDFPGKCLGTVTLPEMQRGRVHVCLATLLARSTGNQVAHTDYPNVLQAQALARGQLAFYEGLERQGMARLLTSAPALQKHTREWEAWETSPEKPYPPLGFIISMESADPILAPEDLEQWYGWGVRVIGPTHFGYGRYAGGTGTEAGVNELGLKLLDEMARLNIILDLSHFSDPAFWQALERFPGQVLASHNNCRELVPNQRQFSDEQIKTIISRGGIIGTAMDNTMLSLGYKTGSSDHTKVKLNQVVDHIDHICHLAGNSQHAAIGSDLDGGYGWDQSPYDLDTIADVQKIPVLLAQRGFSAADIENICYKNWLRFFIINLK